MKSLDVRDNEAVLDLANELEKNNWMTGQIINLDGGEVIGNSGEFNILHKLKKEDWEKIKK